MTSLNSFKFQVVHYFSNLEHQNIRWNSNRSILANLLVTTTLEANKSLILKNVKYKTGPVEDDIIHLRLQRTWFYIKWRKTSLIAIERTSMRWSLFLRQWVCKLKFTLISYIYQSCGTWLIIGRLVSNRNDDRVCFYVQRDINYSDLPAFQMVLFLVFMPIICIANEPFMQPEHINQELYPLSLRQKDLKPI